MNDEGKLKFRSDVALGLSLLIGSEISDDVASRLISALCGLNQSEGKVTLSEEQGYLALYFRMSVVSQIQAWDAIVAARAIPASLPVDLG